MKILKSFGKVVSISFVIIVLSYLGSVLSSSGIRIIFMGLMSPTMPSLVILGVVLLAIGIFLLVIDMVYSGRKFDALYKN